MRMLRRTEFYPWPNGPCYRALCSLGLGGFPPAGARADQAGGASQVSARSEHARSLRRPGTRHAELRYRGPWSPGTGILVSDNFQSCRVERKEPHDLEAPSWARTGSTHHPCGGGLTGCACVPRMRGEFRCCSRASRPRDDRACVRLRPWLLQTPALLVHMGCSRGKRCTGLVQKLGRRFLFSIFGDV